MIIIRTLTLTVTLALTHTLTLPDSGFIQNTFSKKELIDAFKALDLDNRCASSCAP